MPISDQVGERLFGLRIALQDALVNLGGLVELAQHLQRHGLAEQRVVVVGRLGQAFVEGCQAGLGILQMQMADAHAELRFQARRIQVRRGLNFCAASCQRPRFSRHTAMLNQPVAFFGSSAQEFAIAFHAASNWPSSHWMCPMAEYISADFSPLRSGAVQFLECVLQFAFKVQGDRPGHGAGRLGTVGPLVQQNRPQVSIPAPDCVCTLFIS